MLKKDDTMCWVCDSAGNVLVRILDGEKWDVSCATPHENGISATFEAMTAAHKGLGFMVDEKKLIPLIEWDLFLYKMPYKFTSMYYPKGQHIAIKVVPISELMQLYKDNKFKMERNKAVYKALFTYFDEENNPSAIS